jgi:hypothetical protein
MKSVFLLGLGLLVTTLASAQGTKGVRMDFRFSRVVLTNGDTLSGPVSLRQSPDVLYLAQPDGSVRTLVPAMVAAFAVQGALPVANSSAVRPSDSPDPTVVRLFRTLNLKPERLDLRPEPLFFEQLSEGPALLLRRQTLVPHQIARYALGGPVRAYGSMAATLGRVPVPVSTPMSYRTVTTLEDVFYLALAPDDVRQLHHIRKDLLAAFPGQAQQLQAYAKARNLDYANAFELHQLVSYANSLSLAVAP